MFQISIIQALNRGRIKQTAYEEWKYVPDMDFAKGVFVYFIIWQRKLIDV